MERTGLFELSLTSHLDSVKRLFDSNPALESFSKGSSSEEKQDQIPFHFYKKECSTFIPAGPNAQQRCGCGYLKVRHDPDVSSGQYDVWSSKKHTVEIPTDSFGSLSFSHEEQDREIASKYIRLADNTASEKIWLLFSEIWGLKSPTLILSILGGNNSEVIDTKLRQSLEEGLEKLLKVMDIWLLTGATESAVTRTASSAFHHYSRKERLERNACLGIGPWGCIASKEDLQGQSSAVVYEPMNEELEVKKNLCTNHTHFLLVDDGSVNKFGTDRKLRTALNNCLSNKGGDLATPVINLLFCGGHSACRQIKENLKSSKRIPCVVMKGSGGLANVLCEALHKHKTENLSGVRLQLEIRNKVEKDMELKIDEVTNVVVTSAVKEIIEQHKDQIVVFDPAEDLYGLHHALIEASTASTEGTEQKDRFNGLQLAIHLDEIDVAKRDLQTKNADTEFMKKAMYKSIKAGKSKFVQFFLTQEMNLKEFIGEDKETLRKLYSKTLKNSNFLQELLTNAEEKSCRETSFDLKIVDRLLLKFMDEDYSKSYAGEISKRQALTPCQDLIIWAILNDMPDMAECFWKHEKKRALENAIVMFRLYRSMSIKLQFIDEVKRAALLLRAEKYEQNAVELLSLCYSEAPESAVEVIKTKIPLWGDNSLVSLAANGRSRDFVSHISCQSYLNNIWRGKDKMSAYRRRKKRRRYTDETDHRPEPRFCIRLCQQLFFAAKFLLFVPKGKLVLDMFFYLTFLACFAYYLLIKREEASKALWVYINIYVASFTFESIREICDVKKKTVFMKCKEWFNSMWKKIELLAVVLFYIGVGMSFNFESASKSVFAVDIVLWVVMFSQYYRMIQSLGPYLTMVYRMLLHMTSFILVLLTVVLAYGIFMYLFLYKSEDLSWTILFKMLFRPYLLVFGELGISTYSISDKTTVFGTIKLGTAKELIAVLGMCVYLLVANVLLLNMLIAVFNNIYEDIKVNSDKIWRFDRYYLINEYNKRPILPPPFCAIFTLVSIISKVIIRRRCIPVKKSLDKDIQLEMEDLQLGSAKVFLKGVDQKVPDAIENAMKVIKERVDGNAKALIKLNEKIEEKLTNIELMLKLYRRQERQLEPIRTDMET